MITSARDAYYEYWHLYAPYLLLFVCDDYDVYGCLRRQRRVGPNHAITGGVKGGYTLSVRIVDGAPILLGGRWWGHESTNTFCRDAAGRGRLIPAAGMRRVNACRDAGTDRRLERRATGRRDRGLAPVRRLAGFQAASGKRRPH